MKIKNLFIPAIGCLLGLVAITPALFGEKDSKLGAETLEWLMSGDLGRGLGHPVTAAPFSAQVIVENTRTLANGVHISEKSAGALYRDSQGRVRHEKPRDGNAEIAIIDDPVAGVQYRLHLFQHTVTQFSYNDTETASNPEREARRRAEEAERAIKTSNEASNLKKSREGVSEPKTESLGVQMIEGVQAQGQRSTRTVAAGAMGNDKEFDIVQETWYSPALQMVVMFKMTNPARGDLTMRLANINQSEPAHSLFEPPSDFTAAEKTEGSRR
jgi:hypothetical protein